jgi:hypothetical protein
MIELTETIPGWIALNNLPAQMRTSRQTLDRRIQEHMSWEELKAESFSQKKLFLRTGTVLELIAKITDRKNGVGVSITPKAINLMEAPIGYINKAQIRKALCLTQKQYEKVLKRIFATDRELMRRYRGNGRKWDITITDSETIIAWFAPDRAINIQTSPPFGQKPRSRTVIEESYGKIEV